MSYTSMRGCRPILTVVLGAALALLPALAHAGPRDDMKAAYWSAIEQFNNLDLDAAMATLDGAVSQAQAAGMSSDPVLAPLLVVRGGIIYTNTGDAARTVAALEEAVRADYYVQLPIELRSEELQGLLDQARSRAGQPPAEPVLHTAPTATLAGDLEFEAQMGIALPDGAQAALYWRKVGEPDFQTVSMDLFFNFATATIPASDHLNSDIEYFVYVFDANNQPLANKGDQDAPLAHAGAAPADAGGTDVPPDDGTGQDDGKDKPPPSSGETLLPRVWINLGVGTGFGVARGGAELTYQQFNPADPNFQYGPSQEACAIARWFGKDGSLPGNGAELGAAMLAIENQVPGSMPTGLLQIAQSDPTGVQLDAIYDSGQCGERHPIKGGMASSPFFIAPEVAVRIGKKFSLGLFSRLQVVTGSKVFRGDDPNANVDFAAAYANMRGEDPVSQTLVVPQGEQDKPPFTWALGLKAKYFFGKDDKKFRVFLGGFAGYGRARLRVPMGFANDHSGNSIPDDQEVSCDAPLDPVSLTYDCLDPNAAPVWPYNLSTEDSGAGQIDRDRAGLIQTAADSAQRIDTVALGQGFVGILVGFNFQLHKNFALFAEFDAGAWFPNTTSGLFDLSLGPAITF